MQVQTTPVRWTKEGCDEFGRYLEFRINQATARLRWINPGEFLMGSPASEPGRLAREMLHSVTITRGFWLADTACTQLLWQEVMGQNPAKFKGESLPVEQISWKDTGVFLSVLNGANPTLRLRLPTEAEWEYACRAGTKTPFWCGETISPDFANYNGAHPYEGAPKGAFRNKTVAVRSMPPNGFGLYEMHGNTWEWCQDYFAECLGHEPVTDPKGPPEGEFRLMRGGCWYDHAHTLRSASRDTGREILRVYFLGFRFARDDTPII